eukprot:2523181-Rhodomonas_salina.2
MSGISGRAIAGMRAVEQRILRGRRGRQSGAIPSRSVAFMNTCLISPDPEQHPDTASHALLPASILCLGLSFSCEADHATFSLHTVDCVTATVAKTS